MAPRIEADERIREAVVCGEDNLQRLYALRAQMENLDCRLEMLVTTQRLAKLRRTESQADQK
jgi:hypothetical protein